MEKPISVPEEEVLRLRREFSILNAISQTVNQSVDLDEILNNSLDKMMEMASVRSAGIYLLDEIGNDLTYVTHRGFSKVFSKGMKRVKLGETLTGRAALGAEPIFVEDYPNHPEAIPLEIEEGIRSLAIIPLKSGMKMYGTLNVARKECHQFDPHERDLFNSIGQIITGALERASFYSENVKRLGEEKILYSISQEIASRLELKGILQKIIESAVDLLRADSGSIALWDQRKQNYALSIVHRLPETLIGREFSVPSEGIIGDICTKKAPVLYEDYEHHPKRLKELDACHFKEMVGVPLIVREMLIGTMVILTSDPKKHFQQSEIDLLFNFAHQAAIAIGNSLLYEDSLAKIRQLTALYEVGKVLSSTLDLSRLLEKGLELLHGRLGYDSCGILMVDDLRKDLFIKQVVGRDFESVKHLRFRIGIDGIVGWVAKTGEPYYAPDVSKDSHYFVGAPEIKSEAAFPLRVGEEVIGVLNVESHTLRGFDEDDLKVLSSFSSQMSISIENAQLFSELKRTLTELKQAQEQIIQTEKLKALGEMASGVAHDFNNLLAVILGNIQLLSYQLDQLGLEEIRERLKAIERSSKDGAETVRRIQEFTGIRRDKEFSPVSINELLHGVIVVTEPRWKDQTQRRGIHIDLSTQLEEVPFVLGSPSELREVLTNIVFNAIDAMPEGGRLTLSTHHPAEDWVEVRVSDTGVGMTEEVKRRIFDPFFTTKGVTNSGLGMSVSYGIIKRHGGEILVESSPGKGSTFAIHLPTGYFAEEPEANDAEFPSETPSARILVVEDDASVQEILGQMLVAKGHRVVVASDGEEGIAKFKTGQFDLVFTDLGMPKLSGWEVGKILKKIDPHVPIAMITGWGVEVHREKMLESGIDIILPKPFDFEQISQIISKALDRTAKN
jgi:signal transduction histidine kinase/CheY-like chemotaxis protein